MNIIFNNDFVSSIYVGSDGKLHKVVGGADTALNFSSVKTGHIEKKYNYTLQVKSVTIPTGITGYNHCIVKSTPYLLGGVVDLHYGFDIQTTIDLSTGIITVSVNDSHNAVYALEIIVIDYAFWN